MFVNVISVKMQFRLFYAKFNSNINLALTLKYYGQKEPSEPRGEAAEG